MKRAFTLAEVLITLGIIGVVATMTIPIVINKYRSYVLEVQFKKAYSNLSQAILLMKLLYILHMEITQELFRIRMIVFIGIIWRELFLGGWNKDCPITIIYSYNLIMEMNLFLLMRVVTKYVQHTVITIC